MFATAKKAGASISKRTTVDVVVAGTELPKELPAVSKQAAQRVVSSTGDATFDVTGNPVDERGPVKADKFYPIHRAAPPLTEQSTSPQVLTTGIKVIDLICPFLKGGKVGAFGGAGVGKTVLVMELIHAMAENELGRVAWIGTGVMGASMCGHVLDAGYPVNVFNRSRERAAGLVERGVSIERIVWMGGAIAEGNVTPAAEFNAFVDPEAAAAVFASGIPITMVGLDVTHKALFTRAHADRLRGAGKVGRAVAELSDFFQRFHEQRYGFDGSPIHDAMAVAEVIDPTLMETVHCNVEIETASQHCDGRTVVDRWLVTDRPRNARVGVDVDAARFLELLVVRLASLG